MGEVQSKIEGEWVTLSGGQVLSEESPFYQYTQHKKTKIITDNLRGVEREELFKGFKMIQMWRVEELWIEKTRRQNIMKDFVHVQFPNLQVLCLSRNGINSIEVLSHLNCPNLTKIYLSYNYLTKLRTLKKCYFPFLKAIGLSNNRINDIENSTELKSKILNSISIEFYLHQEQSPNLNWLTKMETNSLEILRIQSPKRLKSQNDQVLRRKFLGIRIYPKNA